MERDENRAVCRCRQQTVEAAFGVMKQPMGLRSFLRREKDRVTADWQ